MGNEATDLLKGDEAGEESEAPETEEAEAPDAEEAETEEGPDADHPRFKQIYGQLKQRERELQSLKDDVSLMRQHNEKMSEQMRSQDAAMQAAAKPNEPDIEEDPAQWRQWKLNEDQIARDEMKSEMQSQQLAWQVDILRSMHKDYDEKVKGIAAQLDSDETLREQVWSATNPPLAAYNLASKTESDLSEAENTADQLTVPDGERSVASRPKGKISDDERRMMKVFGMNETEWREQRSILAEERGPR